jgi:galactonate dehydratase
MREIAAMAEAYTVAVAPHGNNSTSIGLAASLQVAAGIPNFLIMEYPVSWQPIADEIGINPLVVEQGAIALPTTPGIGLDLNEVALARFPYRGGRLRPLPQPADERP